MKVKKQGAKDTALWSAKSKIFNVAASVTILEGVP